MPIPPFRNFGPAEAVRQLSQWMHQPQLTQALKDAAQRLGMKEVPSLASVQEMLRAAGKWAEALVEPWSATTHHRLLRGVNATGELFSLRWTAPRLTPEVLGVSQALHAGFTEDVGMLSQVRTLVSGATGAADVIVTPNLAIALQLVANGLARENRIQEVWLPRAACQRLPAGATQGGIHVRSVLDASSVPVSELGTGTECGAEDFSEANSGRKPLLLLASPCPGQIDRMAGRERVRQAEGWVCELALDGSLHDLRSLGWNIDGLSRRWNDVDLLIVPGHLFLGGPECALVLGQADAMASIRSLAEQTGMQADRATHVLLGETVRGSDTMEGWSRTPIGATLTTSLENLQNRAQRIALQCDGVPGLDRIEIHRKPCKIGTGFWQSTTLESSVLSLFPSQGTSSRLSDLLLQNEPPIWSHVHSDHVELVMRTVEPAEDHWVVAALQGLDGSPTASPDPSPHSETTVPGDPAS